MFLGISAESQLKYNNQDLLCIIPLQNISLFIEEMLIVAAFGS